jgi:hypothetical protein
MVIESFSRTLFLVYKWMLSHYILTGRKERDTDERERDHVPSSFYKGINSS